MGNERVRKHFMEKEKKQAAAFAILLISALLIAVLGKVFFIPGVKRIVSYHRLVNHSVKVGDRIVFGNKNWNNTWRVLDVEDTRILLITDRIVDSFVFNGIPPGNETRPLDITALYPFPKEGESIARSDSLWDKSDMKDFLNNDYYDNEFKDYEKEMIHDYGCGKVFLLSSEEAEKYFLGVNERQAYFTSYPASWWLRSSVKCGDGEYVSFVDYYGRIINEHHEYVGAYTSSRLGIRPAIWLEIK